MPHTDETLLVVSSFPPTRCGIGRYAADQCRELAGQGYRVRTATHDPTSAADITIDLTRPAEILKALAALMRQRFDGIIVHYADEFFFPSAASRRKDRLLQLLFFLLLALKSGRAGALIFHETARRASTGRWFRWLEVAAFGRFRTLVFHTEEERDRLLNAHPLLLRAGRARIQSQQRYVHPEFHGTQAEARQALGLPDGVTIFLCIGFIQAHKGFHLAVDAFAAAARTDAMLYIVGSVRLEDQPTRAYRDALLERLRDTPNAHLVEQFVDNVGFDRWIAAADVVLLPYVEISSSGVGARAAAYSRDVIINAMTNLGGQFRRYDHVHPYQDEAGLVGLLRTIRRRETGDDGGRHASG